MQTVVPRAHSALASQVEALSGQSIYRCNQCGKCTAGCPAALDMDLPPRRVLRALQLGLEEEVLGCTSIWVCLYCRACSVRCPMEIDIDQVMEALRLMAVARRRAPEPGVARFHRLFLWGLRRHGRIHELGLGAWFNLLSMRPWANVGRLPALILRGRLHLMHPRVKGQKEVKAIFSRARGMAGGAPTD